MFTRAVIKLTAWYLLLIMLLSLFFSVLLYHALSREVEASLRRQAPRFTADQPGAPVPRERFEDFRREEVAEAQRRTLGQLVLFNLAVLLAGASLSYVLARRTLRPIEEALAAQKRFTSDASHELRTPLAIMRAELEVALRGHRGTTKSDTKLLRSTLEEVVQLEQLTNRLLELARADEAPVRPGACDVQRAVERAVQRNRQLAKKHRVTLIQNVSSCRVAIDPDVLVDILSILVENGIKYNRMHGRVEIAGHLRAGQAVVDITDTGVGIPLAEQGKIFERFHQVDTSRTRVAAEGFGLGLPLARRLLERYGGSISLVSSSENGSTFALRLPPTRDSNAHLQN